MFVRAVKPHGAALNGNRIRPHVSELFGHRAVNGGNRRDDSHQRHNSKCNNKYGKGAPQHIGTDRLECYPDILPYNSRSLHLSDRLRTFL